MASIQVTKCAAAYQDLSEDQSVNIDSNVMESVMAVEPILGIGNSIIFFRDSSSMNVVESPEELFARRFESL